MSANGDDMGDTTADADADAGGSDRPDPSLPGNNEPGEFDPIERGIDAARLQRQRQQLRRRAANEAGSDYSTEDIAVREGEDDRLRAQITPQAREREREEARQAALEDAAEEFDQYSTSDLEIVQEDGEKVIQPTETAVERERQETREELRQKAVQNVEGIDDPSAIEIVEDGDTLQTELTDEAREQLAIERTEGLQETETVPTQDDVERLSIDEAEELMEGYPVPPQREVVTSIRDVNLAELPESTAEDIVQALESGEQADIGLSPTGRTVDREGGPLSANEQSQRVIVRPDEDALVTADTTEARIAAQLGADSVQVAPDAQPSDRNVLDDFRGDTSPGQLDPVGESGDGGLPADEVQDAGRVEGGLDELQFDDDGTVVIDESDEPSGGTVRDPANLDDAGRVEGGLDELRFGDEGTAIIEETPTEQGIETDSDAAARVEETFTERTGLDDDEVRVDQTYEGEYVASPTEQFERGVETQTADELGVDPETVETDVDQDFSTDTDLSREGQRQRAEQALEAQLGEELEQSDIMLVEEDGETRARLAGRAAVEQANEALIERNRELADEVSSEVSRLEDILGTELSPGDYSVSRGEDGEVQVELTESARERVSEELVQGEQQGGESEVFIDDLPEGGLEGTDVQDAPSQTTTAQSSNIDSSEVLGASFGDAEDSIEQQLENETGVELDDADIELERDGEQLTGQLSDEGEVTVAREQSPFQGTPVEGLFEAGSEARVALEQQFEPAEEAWEDATPDQDDVFGPVPNYDLPNISLEQITGAAALGVAAPEPVSTGTGAVVLGTIAAGTLTASAANELTEGAPDVSESAELEVPEDSDVVSGSEISVDEETNIESPEIEVPEERTTIAPEEIGIPRDVVQDGNIDINGPDGSEITDEGDIVIPADTTQVSREERYEDEEEVDDEDEETQEDEEEDQVIVEVPEELIPDEEVTIGEPTETVEEEPADEIEESEDEEFEELLPEQGQAVDDLDPEQTRVDEEFDERPLEDDTGYDELEEAEDLLDTDEALDTGVGGGAETPAASLPVLDEREQTATQDVVGADLDELLGSGTADNDLLGDMAGDMVGDLVGQQATPIEMSDQIGAMLEDLDAVQDTQLETAQEPAFGNPTTQPTLQEVQLQEPAQPTAQEFADRGQRGQRPRLPDPDDDEDERLGDDDGVALDELFGTGFEEAEDILGGADDEDDWDNPML